MRPPMPRDIRAGGDPDAVMPGDMVKKPDQPCGATGTAREPAVQTHAHHARAAGQTVLIQHVERVAQIGKEFV